MERQYHPVEPEVDAMLKEGYAAPCPDTVRGGEVNGSQTGEIAAIETDSETSSQKRLGEVATDSLEIVADNVDNPEAQSEEKLFTAGEAAEMLGVNYKTIMRWSRKGNISCFRTPGGEWRFPANEIRTMGNVEAGEEFDYTMKTQEATACLGISGARLRRLADYDILDSIRTAGNQRRYRNSQINAIATLLSRRSEQDIATLRALGLGSLLTN